VCVCIFVYVCLWGRGIRACANWSCACPPPFHRTSSTPHPPEWSVCPVWCQYPLSLAASITADAGDTERFRFSAGLCGWSAAVLSSVSCTNKFMPECTNRDVLAVHKNVCTCTTTECVCVQHHVVEFGAVCAEKCWWRFSLPCVNARKSDGR
jgi:hypothetical protein